MTGTKIDTIKIRQLNREQTFEYIKKNPMAARADVAKELNLSFPTVTSIVTELEEAGPVSYTHLKNSCIHFRMI